MNDYSRDYLDDLDAIRRMVPALLDVGWSLHRVVVRARNLYRDAYLREVTRYRTGNADAD